MNYKLKAPGTERLKLKYDNMPSRLAFKFNLRRYSMAADNLAMAAFLATLMVGRCRLTLWNPS